VARGHDSIWYLGLEMGAGGTHILFMIWFGLVLLVFMAIFLRRVVMPMALGFGIGVVVFFAAPLLKFTAVPEIILFCAAAGLAIGMGRVLMFGDGAKE